MGTLTTIAICWISASYVLAIAIPADQLRRPRTEWEAAGRSRRFWVALTLIMGFHGLGPYAAAAYLYDVRPRLRAAERGVAHRRGDRAGAAVASRWRSTLRAHATRYARRAEPSTAAEELAIVAALLMLASSLIHAAVIAGHFAEYWLFGVLFAVVSLLQALWTAQVYSRPLDARLLAAGAVLNTALIVVWATSRTTGLPLGPDAGEPESIGPADIMSTVDELLSVLVIAAMLGLMRRRTSSLPRPVLSFVVAIVGAVWLFSVMSPFAGSHGH